jgi:hypothetical protein
MVGTWKVLEPIYPISEPTQLLDCINDILCYLTCPIYSHDGYIFWKRNEFDHCKSENLLEDQYWVNSILISSTVFAYGDLNESQQSMFESLVRSLKLSIEQKIAGQSLQNYHEVVVTRSSEYGDVIVSLVRREWSSREK